MKMTPPTSSVITYIMNTTRAELTTESSTLLPSTFTEYTALEWIIPRNPFRTYS